MYYALPIQSENSWQISTGDSNTECSDVNKDWTHKDKDLTYKDSKQKRRQAQHSFFKTVSLNVFKKHW